MDGIKPGPAKLDRSSPFVKQSRGEPPAIDPLTGEIHGDRPQSENAEDRPKYVMEVRGLTVDRPLSYDEWVALMEQLRATEHGYQWWIGDGLNYGEAAYGEKYANAVSPKQADTWKNYASICGQYEKSRRSYFLTWTHYSIVAYIEEPRRSELLAQAVKEGLTTRQLTNLKNGKPINDPPPTNEPAETDDDGIVFMRPHSFEGTGAEARTWADNELNSLAGRRVRLDLYTLDSADPAGDMLDESIKREGPLPRHFDQAGYEAAYAEAHGDGMGIKPILRQATEDLLAEIKAGEDLP